MILTDLLAQMMKEMASEQFGVALEKAGEEKYNNISQFGDQYLTPMECDNMNILE